MSFSIALKLFVLFLSSVTSNGDRFLYQQYVCPTGFTPIGYSCYYINSTQLSRDDAQITCEGLDAHLDDITSSEEDAIVRSLALDQGVARDYWIGIGKKKKKFHWMNGSPMIYENWEVDEIRGPLNEGSDCIRIRLWLTTWNDMFCDRYCRYICEGNIGDPFCSGVTYIFQSSCYTKSNTTVQRDQARVLCEDAGGHLLYIETEEENDYLSSQQLFGDDGEYWIGLTQRVPGSNQTDFIWKTREPLVYTNFGYLNRGTDCVRITSANGYTTWNDEICFRVHGFICEYTDRSRNQQQRFTLKEEGTVPSSEHVINDVIVDSFIKCSSLCASTRECASLAYSRSYGTCILANSTTGTLPFAYGFRYYTKNILVSG